jgi:hypothetical protein
MRTRWTRISQAKAATMGKAYTDKWLGAKVVFTSYEGERIVGEITKWDASGLFPIASFADGSWARLDSSVEVVNV